MGLDMNLYATRYLSSYNDKVNKRAEVRKLFPEIEQEDNSIELRFNIGYWRKANHIHKWFIKDEEEDNCRRISICREQLIELKEICLKVLKNKKLAPDLLPVQEGFFFGGTKYDEYYFNDIEQTIEIINKCLQLNDDWYFEYQASW